VRFRRTPDTRPLPYPERGGSIGDLRPFLPNLTGDDFTLVLAFLLAALQPDGPYPVLAVYGEQGWAKTNLLRILRALTDPHRAPTTPSPSSARDLFVSARNSHVQAFENVSKLSDAMSDNLCRLSTGGGMRTRALFTNSDEATFVGARPIMLEGIANFVVRPDLIDRSLIIALESPPGDRRTQRELGTEFERRGPRIFGTLCDMLAAGVRRLPETRLLNPPRMADFATWTVACGVEGLEAAYAQSPSGARCRFGARSARPKPGSADGDEEGMARRCARAARPDRRTGPDFRSQSAIGSAPTPRATVALPWDFDFT